MFSRMLWLPAFILLLSVSAFSEDKIEHKLYLKSGTLELKTQFSFGQGATDFSTKYYIFKYNKTPSQQHFSELKKFNIQWLRYIPDNALLVLLPKATSNPQVDLKDIMIKVPYLPKFKMNSDLNAISVFNQHHLKTVNIKLFNKKSVEKVADQILSLGGQVLEHYESYIDARLSLSMLRSLSQIDEVEFISEKPYVEVMSLSIERNNVLAASGDYSDLSGFETGTKIMNFSSAWYRGLDGRGQIVAMADTGLDSGDKSTLHRDFSGVSHGYSYGLFTNSWYDPMGHGTHVAGSVMSAGVASGGEFRGGAYGSNMIAQGMWSDLLKNLSIPPTLEKFLAPAYQDGARVHTNSWGSPRNLGAYDNMSAQVDDFMWKHPEMLIIFAAGNSGEDGNRDGRIDEGSVSSPSTAKNALSVGASENLLLTGGIQRPVGQLADGKWSAEPLGSDKLSDNADGIAVFSSRGPTSDGRLKPDVVAPGTNILSNCSQVKDANPLWGKYNDDYCYSGGTSMSAPLVAGAAAVVRQYLEERGASRPSAALVKAVLMNSAVDLYPGQFGNVGKSRGQELLSPGPNVHQGHGRVDLARATDDSLVFIDEKQGLAQGEEKSHPVVLSQGGYSRVKIHLVYTDRPAASAASRTLVNDLDMEVVTSDGKVILANDKTNNFEYIELPLDTLSDLTIKVKGERVMQGTQPYAWSLSYY